MIWTLFITFLGIGLMSIGGGYAVIPLIRERVVDALQWISEDTFTDIITISQMTPGPLAVNTSTFVGIQIAGIPGAVSATLGCVLMGVLISLTLYHVFRTHSSSELLFEVLNGLKSASLGLITSAAAAILMLTFWGSSDIRQLQATDLAAAGLFFLAFLLLRLKRTGPIALMAVTGILGLFCYL